MDQTFSNEITTIGLQVVQAIVGLAWAALVGLIAHHAPKVLALVQRALSYKIVQDAVLWAAREFAGRLRDPDDTAIVTEPLAVSRATDAVMRRVGGSLDVLGVYREQHVRSIVAARLKNELWGASANDHS